MAGKKIGFATGIISCVLLLAQLCNCQPPPELDGAADGANGHKHITGSPNTEKIILGLNCIKDTATSTGITFQFYVYQSDDAFKFLPAATTVRKGELITFTTCDFIDANQYATTKNVEAATADAQCGGSVRFIDIAVPTGSSLAYETRAKTKELTVSDPTDVSAYKCGSRKVGTDIETLVYCKRDPGYDKAFDIIFIAKYGTDGCTATAVTTSSTIADPPTVNVKYNIEATMKLYKNLAAPLTGPESPSANEITTAQPLGTSAYIEVCARIPQVASATVNEINNQFFANGISTIAFLPYDCTAAADIDNQEFLPTVESRTTWETLIDSNGCGAAGTGTNTGKGLDEFFATDMYMWSYAETTPAVAKHWLKSPNCVRSITFPLVSYARAKSTDIVDTIITCKLARCISGDDNRCFANKATGTDNYPTCPAAGSGRKKRETFELGPEIPTEVSVRFRVILPGANATSTTGNAEGCFERNIFIGLTSALVALLAAVLIAAVFLSVKLATSDPESSTDSMTGIQNKGYY